MKIINFEDIVNLNISPMDCYYWVEEMLMQKYTALLPPKISMKQAEQSFCNVMPSVLPGLDAMGVKIVTRYPAREPSLESQIILYRQRDGEPLALMDGTYITALRTGAVAAHSICTFAKSDYKTIGVLGLGNTARATMHIYASMNDKAIEVKLLRYKDQAESFIERFKHHSNLKFSIYDSAKELIAHSDVTLSCITYTDELLAPDSTYKPGCTVIPIHTRGFQNCDLFFDKVFADDRGHVEGFQNFKKFKSFSETCDVIAGKVPGRANDEERILVYNIGISVHDVFFASKIYSMIREGANKRYDDIYLTPKDIGKFWV